MKPSKKFYNLITLLEGMRTKAYLCSAGKWTIGVGSTTYPDGTKVKRGDVCTTAQAYEYLEAHLTKIVGTINGLLNGVTLNQNQFDAVVSLVYNIGTGNFAASSVLKLIRKNANDPRIEEAWLAWRKETKNGKKVDNVGLLNRRKKEYKLYCTPLN